MAELLRERIKKLDEEIAIANNLHDFFLAGLSATPIEMKLRRKEAQLVLNTILLEKF
jgi:hypothetical protein